MIEIYTDGSANPNTKCGGWAIVIVRDGICEQTYSDYEINTTNNRMEMLAIISALKWLKNNSVDSATLYTDSAYIHNCLDQKWFEKWSVNGWKTANKKPVLNKDLWEELLGNLIHSKYNLKKVSAHSGVEFNEKADKLAVKTRKNIERNIKNESCN